MEEEYIKIGKLDVYKYKDLSDRKLLTDKIVITYKQIEHINERRNGIFDKYKDNLEQIINNPDYILKDPKHKHTAMVTKKFDNNVVVILKINTTDNKRKNSIITIWEIKDKRLQRYLQTHEILYKKE